MIIITIILLVLLVALAYICICMCVNSSSVIHRYVGGNDDPLNSHYKKLREKLELYDSTIKNKTIVQLHYADWCKYCREMKPAWEQTVETLLADKSNHYLISTLDHNDCKPDGVKTIPLIVKYTPNHTLSRYHGPKKSSDILAWIRGD